MASVTQVAPVSAQLRAAGAKPLWVAGEGSGTSLGGCSGRKQVPPNLLPPSLVFWGSSLKDSHGGLGAAWLMGSGMGEQDGGEDPKISQGFGMWGCMHLAWGSGLYARDAGATCILLGWGVRTRGHLGFIWGWNVGTARVTFGFRIWGPSHHTAGQDVGIPASCSRAGTWDPHGVLRGRRWGPSHRAQSGCRDP